MILNNPFGNIGFAEETLPRGLLIEQFKAQKGEVPFVAADRVVSILPKWIDGKCTFVDHEGVRVFSYTPYTAAGSTRGRELIEEAHIPLPENGNYYERLYATKSYTQYRFYAYLTDAWAKVSNYTVTQGKTVTWTHSGGLDYDYKNIVVGHYQLSKSMSSESSVGSQIPADASRYSKLGLFVKYAHNDIELHIYAERNGEVITDEWEYGTTENPYDLRIDPVYQG